MLRTCILILISCATAFSQGSVDVVLQVGHNDQVNALAFSADGKYFATASNDQTAKLWNVNTGKNYTFGGNVNYILDVTFSPDGKTMVYITSSDIKWIDTKNFKQIGYYGRSGAIFNRAKFLPNGKLLVTSHGTDGIYVFEPGTNTKPAKIPHSFTSISTLVLDPASHQMAIMGQGLTIEIWDYLTMQKTAFYHFDTEYETPNIGTTVKSVAFSPDGQWLAACAYTGEMQIWNTVTKESKLSRPNDWMSQLEFSPDSKQLVGIGNKGFMRVWSTQNWEPLFDITGHQSTISSVHYHPAGQFIATTYEGDQSGSNDYSIKFWSTENGVLLRSYQLTGYLPKFVGFLEGQNKILIHREDEQFFVFDLDYLSLQQLNSGATSNISTTGYDLSQGRLAIARKDGSIDIRNIDNSSNFDSYQNFKGHGIRKVALSRDGKYLAVASTRTMMGAATISLLNLENRSTKIIKELSENQRVYNLDLAFDSLSNNLAISTTAQVYVYSMTTGTEINTIIIPGEEFSNIKFTGDGKYLALGYSSGTASAGLVHTKFGLVKSTIQAPDLKHTYVIHSSLAIPLIDQKELITTGYYRDYSIRIHDTFSSNQKMVLSGHQAEVTSLDISQDQSKILSASADGTIRIWDKSKGKTIATLITVGKDGFVIYLPDNYYRASKSAMGGVAFNVNGDLVSFDQLDLFFNRPDIVLDRLNKVKTSTQSAYKKAFDKRVKKMDFVGMRPDQVVNLPEISIKSNSVSGLTTDSKELNLTVVAKDDSYTIDRINVYINNVPIYGSKGYQVKDLKAKTIEKNLSILLSDGINRIQISTHNSNGFESIRESFEVACKTSSQQDTYVVAIGISDYQNNNYDLNFAAKDANDIAAQFGSDPSKTFRITNANATIENILAVKQELMKSKVDDKVILFVAGHGLLDSKLDYYLGTHDVNFEAPSERGLAYEDLEGLLDGIPARKKLVLLDACHSGEVDKEEVTLTASSNTVSTGNVKFRGFTNVQTKSAGIGLASSFELMKELFADLRRNNGAIVISSASGKEFSFESPEWQNGCFTYSLLEGIKSGNADANKDKTITVSEIRDYVSKRVVELTDGKQNPTSRTENLENDFAVW